MRKLIDQWMNLLNSLVLVPGNLFYRSFIFTLQFFPDNIWGDFYQ
jgi:hypothetical protein